MYVKNITASVGGGGGGAYARFLSVLGKGGGGYTQIFGVYSNSVYEKLKATRAKLAPVNLIYGSHFSATEATYKVSQHMGNFVEFTRTFTRITHKSVPL